ncbi:MAG: hypothetical protein E7812_16590 [Phenylobacterium sp.]|nr:MAG: hypothetical protein E7812_16590 [Phenylobacterium sp.]
MTSADDHLKTLFAHHEPPARDPAFATAVMERMARRRCLQDLGLLAGISSVGGAALWGLWPVVQPVLTALSGQLAPTAVALTVALSAVAILTGQFPWRTGEAA